MVDKYLTREEILQKHYTIRTHYDYGDDFASELHFEEGGKRIRVATYYDPREENEFSEEDAIAHWLSMGRTWYDQDEEFFEKRPERETRVLKMRDDDL